MVVQSYTVLVVDKADLVRRTTNRILTKEGYRVLEAADAKEALMVLAMPQAHVDLVLVDAVLPGDDGVALCAGISARWPHVHVVVTFDARGGDTGRPRPAGPQGALPGQALRPRGTRGQGWRGD